MFRHTNHGWIGLDIGASTIKLAQVVRRGDSLRLEDSAIVPRQSPLDSQQPSAESAPVSAADELASALASAPQVKGHFSAALLPTGVCEFNIATQAKGNETAQVAAIAEELATLGVSLEHRVFDYWPSFTTDKGKTSLNVLSTSRNWSDTITEDLSHAGLNCQAIDGLPHALARAVGQLSLGRGKLTGAIDWGHSGATFVLVDGGQPIYVRQLKHTSLATAVSDVGEQLDLQHHEASELLRTIKLAARPGVPLDEVSEVVAEILKPTLAALVSEVQRTLEHLQNVGRTLRPKRLVFTPERIYLFGGGATVGGIDLYLANKLKQEVRIWNLDDSESTASAKASQTPSCLLGPAIALSALKWENSEGRGH